MMRPLTNTQMFGEYAYMCQEILGGDAFILNACMKSWHICDGFSMEDIEKAYRRILSEVKKCE